MLSFQCLKMYLGVWEQYDMLCNGDMTSGDPSGMRNGGWGGCEDGEDGRRKGGRESLHIIH